MQIKQNFKSKIFMTSHCIMSKRLFDMQIVKVKILIPVIIKNGEYIKHFIE